MHDLVQHDLWLHDLWPHVLKTHTKGSSMSAWLSSACLMIAWLTTACLMHIMRLRSLSPLDHDVVIRVCCSVHTSLLGQYSHWINDTWHYVNGNLSHTHACICTWPHLTGHVNTILRLISFISRGFHSARMVSRPGCLITSVTVTLARTLTETPCMGCPTARRQISP